MYVRGGCVLGVCGGCMIGVAVLWLVIVDAIVIMSQYDWQSGMWGNT